MGGGNWCRQKRKDKEDKKEEGNTRDRDSKGGESSILVHCPAVR